MRRTPGVDHENVTGLRAVEYGPQRRVALDVLREMPDAMSSRCGMNCRVSADPTTRPPVRNGRGPEMNVRRMPM